MSGQQKDPRFCFFTEPTLYKKILARENYTKWKLDIYK